MPNFSYKAINESGKTVKGQAEAKDEVELAANLKGMGYYLLEAKAKDSNSNSKSKTNLVVFGKVKRRDLINFSSDLASMLDAGIPILETLQDQIAQTQSIILKRSLEQMHQDISGGKKLSEALERQPKVFSELYVHIVRAGEASGDVAKVLTRLAEFLAWSEELAAKIKRTAIYPSIMFSAVGVVLSVVIFFVLPRLMGILESMDIQLPIFTRFLLGFSNLVKNHYIVLMILMVLSIVVFIILKSTPRGKYTIDNLKLKLPIVGPIFTKLALSRFCHYLSILNRTGIDISQSLQLVEKIIGNAFLAESVSQIRQQVITGKQVSEAMNRSGKFPHMVVRMVAVGEASGNLPESLDKVCRYYDTEVPAATQRLFAFIEPALIICLALTVAFIAASVYLPIYQIVGKMGK